MATEPPGGEPPKKPEERTPSQSRMSEDLAGQGGERAENLEGNQLLDDEDEVSQEQGQDAGEPQLQKKPADPPAQQKPLLPKERRPKPPNKTAVTSTKPVVKEPVKPASSEPAKVTPTKPTDSNSESEQATLSVAPDSPTQQQKEVDKQGEKVVASGKEEQIVAAGQVAEQQEEAAKKAQISLPTDPPKPNPKVTAGEEGEKDKDKIKASGAGAQQKKDDKPGEPAGDKTFGLNWEELGKEFYANFITNKLTRAVMAIVDKVAHIAVKTLDAAYNNTVGRVTSPIVNKIEQAYNKFTGALDEANQALDRAVGVGKKAPPSPPAPPTPADPIASPSTSSPASSTPSTSGSSEEARLQADTPSPSSSLAKPLQKVEDQSKAMHQDGGEGLSTGQSPGPPILGAFDHSVAEDPHLKDQAKEPEQSAVAERQVEEPERERSSSISRPS